MANRYWTLRRNMFRAYVICLFKRFLFCTRRKSIIKSSNYRLLIGFLLWFNAILFPRTLLKQHMHCHREIITIAVFQCIEDDCSFIGRSAAELRVHQTTHSTEKNYVCDFDGCDYRTKTKTLLNR